MDQRKRKRLEAAGYRFTTPEEFLELSPEDVELIEMRLGLARALKELRRKENLTQAAFARRIQSTQARVAKMESASAEVSLAFMLKAMVLMGQTRQAVAKALAS